MISEPWATIAPVQNLPKPPETGATRDVGLDAVRCAGLLLMTGIHWYRVVPGDWQAMRLLHFIGELAPAFFFFGFGATFSRYTAKPWGEKVRLNLGMLLLALAQAAYLRIPPLSFDFFLFLMVSRVAMDAACRVAKTALSRTALGAAAGLALLPLLIWTPQAVDVFAQKLTPGSFPFYPWLGFVVAGSLWARWGNRPTAWLVEVALIAVAAAMYVAGKHLGFDGWVVTKWPLSLPYLLAASGLVALFGRAARRFSSALPGKFLARVSRHLLLATVLHYVATKAVLVVWARIEHQLSLNALSAVAVSLAGTLLACAILAGLTFVTLKLWQKAYASRLFPWVRMFACAGAALCLGLASVSTHFLALVPLVVVALVLEARPVSGKPKPA